MRTRFEGATASTAGGTRGPAEPARGYALCRVLPAAGAVTQRWRNGGGITRQIAVWPATADRTDFIWRVSAAEVNQPGRFSDWSGFDRQLWITRGGGVRLTDPATGAATTLRPGAALDFPGERAYVCDLLGGPVRDLNVILQRDRIRARSTLVCSTQAYALPPGHHLWYCARGRVRIAEARQPLATLAEGDALHLATRSGGAGQAPRHVQLTLEGDAPACIAIHFATCDAVSSPAERQRPQQKHST